MSKEVYCVSTVRLLQIWSILRKKIYSFRVYHYGRLNAPHLGETISPTIMLVKSEFFHEKFPCCFAWSEYSVDASPRVASASDCQVCVALTNVDRFVGLLRKEVFDSRCVFGTL